MLEDTIAATRSELAKAETDIRRLDSELTKLIKLNSSIEARIAFPRRDILELKKAKADLRAHFSLQKLVDAPDNIASLEQQEKWLEAASERLSYYGNLADQMISPITRALDLTASLSARFGGTSKAALADIEALNKIRRGMHPKGVGKSGVKFLNYPGLEKIVKKLAILGIAADGITLVRGILERDLQTIVEGGTGVAGGIAAYLIGGSAGIFVGGGIAFAGLTFLELEGLAREVKQMRVDNAAGQTMRILYACDGVVEATSAWQGARSKRSVYEYRFSGPTNCLSQFPG